jgi:hypothetical protein
VRVAIVTALLLVAAAGAHADERFIMQSNFWVNLHQTLLDSAQNNRLAPAESPMREVERSVWNNAVLLYRSRFSERSAIFDEELMRMNDAFAGATDALPASLPEDLVKALTGAAVVYRKHGWPSDDRANRFWITAADALLRDAGEDLAREHTRVYDVPFPSRVRVDVTAFAGSTGAYTTINKDGFIHTTISSRDPAYQGFASLEMLMHEASHAIVGTGDGQIGPEINRKAAERRVFPPRQLWHAIIFYTSGELTRRALAERGVDYTQFAQKQGMYERAFNRLRGPLETFWQSYMDGKMTREAAIENLVQMTGIAPPPRN